LFLALELLLHLDLLAELLEVTLLAGLGGRLLGGCVFDQLRLDLLHGLVAADCLGKVVCRPGEGDALLAQQGAPLPSGFERLVHEGQLALQVVVDGGYGVLCHFG
jgi:hypothetical protein